MKESLSRKLADARKTLSGSYSDAGESDTEIMDLRWTIEKLIEIVEELVEAREKS